MDITSLVGMAGALSTGTSPQTYLCKFDSEGHRGATYPVDSTMTDEQKEKLIAEGFVEISEEDWNTYVGNNGQGANGTGYVRDPESGRPVDAPPYVPSKEAQLAQLDAQYQQDKEELTKYFAEALLSGDTETQEELQEELAELNATYVADRKKIEEE